MNLVNPTINASDTKMNAAHYLFAGLFGFAGVLQGAYQGEAPLRERHLAQRPAPRVGARSCRMAEMSAALLHRLGQFAEVSGAVRRGRGGIAVSAGRSYMSGDLGHLCVYFSDGGRALGPFVAISDGSFSVDKGQEHADVDFIKVQFAFQASHFLGRLAASPEESQAFGR